MRSKAPLALIEQAVMLLVFALAAVLCLRAFIWSDTASKQSAERDRAFLQAQCAAEAVKNDKGDFEAAAKRCGGSWNDQSWVIFYDEDWNVAEDTHTYTLRCVREESGTNYLGTAVVEVWKGERSLAGLTVAWQEVESDG